MAKTLAGVCHTDLALPRYHTALRCVRVIFCSCTSDWLTGRSKVHRAGEIILLILFPLDAGRYQADDVLPAELNVIEKDYLGETLPIG